jgi:hypothetical protein
MSLVCLRSARSGVGFPLVFKTDRQRDYFRRDMFNQEIKVRDNEQFLHGCMLFFSIRAV